MSPFDQELVEFYRQRMIQQAQAARRSRQVVQPNRFGLHHRLLINTGDILISLGLKLKNLSRPASDQEYTPLYT
jgi:hypothetical protein